MSAWSTEGRVSKKVRSLLLENRGILTIEGVWDNLSRAEKALLSGKSIGGFCAQIPGVVVEGELVRLAATTQVSTEDSSVQDRSQFQTLLLHARIERLLQETGNSCNELLELAREEARLILAQAQAAAAVLAEERRQWEEEKATIARTFPLQLGNPPIILQIGEVRVATRFDTLTKGLFHISAFQVLLSGLPLLCCCQAGIACLSCPMEASFLTVTAPQFRS